MWCPDPVCCPGATLSGLHRRLSGWRVLVAVARAGPRSRWRDENAPFRIGRLSHGGGCMPAPKSAGGRPRLPPTLRSVSVGGRPRQGPRQIRMSRGIDGPMGVKGPHGAWRTAILRGKHGRTDADMEHMPGETPSGSSSTSTPGGNGCSLSEPTFTVGRWSGSGACRSTDPDYSRGFPATQVLRLPEVR